MSDASATTETAGAAPVPNLDPQVAPNEPTTPTDGDESTDEPVDLTGLKKALAAERTKRKQAEGRVKELTPFEKAAKAAEESAKSETQKATEALTSERDARTKAEQALLRYEVAAAKGVPANLAKFLTGANKAEVEAAADELLTEVGHAKPSMPGKPAERMSNGKPSTSNLDTEDPMALIQMARGQSPPK